MLVELFRHPGYYGRSMPLDVIVNGQQVASISANQTISFTLTDEATLQVAMQGSTSSRLVKVSANKNLRFECGTPLWLLFDFMSLCYLPSLRHRVFFLRELSNG
jgi:hypothetical protein